MYTVHTKYDNLFFFLFGQILRWMLSISRNESVTHRRTLSDIGLPGVELVRNGEAMVTEMHDLVTLMVTGSNARGRQYRIEPGSKSDQMEYN